MDNRQAAKEFLYEFCSCVPNSFYFSIDASQKGLGYILGYLRRVDEEVNPGDLARQLNVSTARIAALLKKLEQKGLVERCGSTRDARRTVVRLTPVGRAYVAEKEACLLDKIERLFEKVGQDELEHYVRISQKIARALEE